MFYGYHRVSTKEQNLERGIKGIEDFCKSRNYKLEKVFVDKMSGRTVDRPRYTVLKEDVLRELLKLLNIEELHIMTYKDRIDVFATKEMTPLHVELYERFFSLHPDDAEKEELLKEQIYQD